MFLTTSSISPSKLPLVLERLEHLFSVTGGVDVAVVFDLSPTGATISSANNSAPVPSEMHAFTTMTATLFAHDTLSTLPVLPLTKIASLQDLLQDYVGSLAKYESIARNEHSTKAFKLLPFCTAGQPLDQQTCYFLTDVFQSLRHMATSLTAHGGVGSAKERAADLLGAETAQSMKDFWMEEWVVD